MLYILMYLSSVVLAYFAFPVGAGVRVLVYGTACWLGGVAFTLLLQDIIADRRRRRAVSNGG